MKSLVIFKPLAILICSLLLFAYDVFHIIFSVNMGNQSFVFLMGEPKRGGIFKGEGPNEDETMIQIERGFNKLSACFNTKNIKIKY